MSAWTSIRDSIIGVAPAIAGALGQTVGIPAPVTALALQTLSNHFTGKPDSTPAEIATAVAGATPEQLAALKALDYNFALEKAKLELKPMETEAADRSNARAMQVEALHQDDLLSKRFIYYFSWFWSGFAALYVLLATFIPADHVNQHAADICLGFILGTVVATILAFFYGTSFSERGKSKKADESLARIAEAP